MIERKPFNSSRRLALVSASLLRRADPRTRLALGLCASLMVMLPLERLALFVLVYAGLLAWAGLLPTAARQVWRIRWLLLTLFVVDWLVIDLGLAVVVTARLALLSGVMVLVVSTTTPEELRLALGWLHVPHRYAFSLSLAFQSVALLEEEWQAIREAQRVRGAWPPEGSSRRGPVSQVRDLVALTVPAIVLTTRRAWAMTEAACARGLESPRRRPYRQLSMGWLDRLLLLGALAVGVALWLPWEVL